MRRDFGQPRWGCVIIIGFPKAGDVVACLSVIGNGFAVATFRNYPPKKNTRWRFGLWITLSQ
jgi:hypothetical protein